MEAVSGRRDGAPGRVMMASSSRTMAASSTKTASGRSGSAGSDSMRHPSSARQGLVRRVLRPGKLKVDGLALEMGQFAPPDRWTDLAGDGKKHGFEVP